MARIVRKRTTQISRLFPVATVIVAAALAVSSLAAPVAYAQDGTIRDSGPLTTVGQGMPMGTRGRVIDVVDPPYSAPTDGTSNATPAIQAALDAASRSGGTVVLPAGHTYVVSSLRVGSNTTLQIDGTLAQAADPAYYPYTPVLGHKIANATNGTYTLDAGFVNLPIIMSENAQDVAIGGSGTILPLDSSNESQLIFASSVGLENVSHFEISGLTIRGSHWWNVRVNQSTHGSIHGLVVDSAVVNGDGIDLINDQDVDVFHNNISTGDDGVVIRSEGPGLLQLIAANFGYTTWTDFSRPIPTEDIRVHANVIDNPKASGVAFIPWTWGAGMDAAHPDLVQLRDISVTDNVITSPDPFRCWCNVSSNSSGISGYGTTAGTHAPVSNVTILRNKISSTTPQNQWTIRALNDATGLTTDLPSTLTAGSGQLSWPGDRAYTSFTGFAKPTPDGDFEMASQPIFWSTRGDAGEVGATTVRRLGRRDARIAAEQLTGQWQHFGYVLGEHNRGASLSEGLGFAGADVLGAAGATYTVKLLAQTGPLGAMFYANDTCTHQILAAQHFLATRPRSEAFTFEIPATCGNVQIGVKVGSGTGNWALVDQVQLSDGVPSPTAIIDDADNSSITYSGSWRTDSSSVYYDSTLHFATAAGSSAVIHWYGGQARLIGREDAMFETGSAEVSVDGGPTKLVSWYQAGGEVDQQVVYDTGPLPVGDHTLTVVMTGDTPNEPNIVHNYINIDALAVN